MEFFFDPVTCQKSFWCTSLCSIFFYSILPPMMMLQPHTTTTIYFLYLRIWARWKFEWWNLFLVNKMRTFYPSCYQFRVKGRISTLYPRNSISTWGLAPYDRVGEIESHVPSWVITSLKYQQLWYRLLTSQHGYWMSGIRPGDRRLRKIRLGTPCVASMLLLSSWR